MGIFRRRAAAHQEVGRPQDVGGEPVGEAVAPTEPAATEQPAAQPAAEPAVEAPAEPVFDRSNGPWDLSEALDSESLVDMGALLLPVVAGLAVQIEVDPQSQTPMAVTVVADRYAMQVRAFASPRSGGSWAQVRERIKADLGDAVNEFEGAFGVELLGSLPATGPGGEQVRQPTRFVGVEGPRWLLQALLFGEAAFPEKAGEAEQVLRSFVVRRGDRPVPPLGLLEITVPAGAVPDGGPDTPGAAAPEPEADRSALPDPFERGPEITQIR